MSTFFSPNFPFTPRRFPFFYGWIILVVSTVGTVMSVPGQTIGVSVFTDYLLKALDLSRMQISTAYMFGTILSSLLLPWGGRLYDRVRARIMIVISCSGLALILLYLSQCDRIAGWLSLSNEAGVQSTVGFLVILIGFLFLRYSGQGLLCMTTRSMLGKWFHIKRGLVSGISGVVVTFTFSIAPLGFDHMIQSYGWRGTWMFLSVVSFSMAILGWLFSRDNPEECGLRMDGVTENIQSTDANSVKPVEIREYTVEEARKTYSFWIFNLALSAQSLIITAVTFHIVSVGEQVGLSREEAIAIFLPMSIVSIISNFIFGWVCDHVRLKHLLIFMMTTLAMGILGVPYFSSWLGQVGVIAGFGASNGIFGPMMTVVWPRFFGREHLGAISSLNLSSMVFASAIGPFIFGLSYEWTHTYHAAVYCCLAMPLILFICAIKADNPQKRISSDE